MKTNIFFVAFLLLLSACNHTKKGEDRLELLPEPDKNKQMTLAQKIAYKNGFGKFSEINTIEFTFNVDRGERHFERSWSWSPNTNKVIAIQGKDTFAYNRNNLDTLSIPYDQRFINDKYWLLPAFQLVWDEGVRFTEKENQIAYISKDTLDVLTITYGKEGGYTPGDAYDLYYDDNFMIKEWVFRQSDTLVPSMINTFEDYKDYNGIKIATTHKDSTGGFNLNFTNILVK